MILLSLFFFFFLLLLSYILVIRPLILEKATVEGKPKKSSHSNDSVPKRPSRSQSLIEKGRKPQIRTRRVSKEAPPGKKIYYKIMLKIL